MSDNETNSPQNPINEPNITFKLSHYHEGLNPLLEVKESIDAIRIEEGLGECYEGQWESTETSIWKPNEGISLEEFVVPFHELSSKETYRGVVWFKNGSWSATYICHESGKTFWREHVRPIIP